MIDQSIELKAPFPWFGGKALAAPMVWERLGDTPNFIEPFFGSGAMLLKRPHPPRLETINDIDGMVANFWRALQDEPNAIAHYADWPVNENDLHARHYWLVQRRESLRSRLEGDPDWYDVNVAGWWVWGICCWIGGHFCATNGPWRAVETENGKELLKTNGTGAGVSRRLVHLGDAGRGVHRKRVHLLGAGQGVHRRHNGLKEWMHDLADRLRYVRVCCGDWSRVCGPTPTIQNGLTAVFLDPPYSDQSRDNVYSEDSYSLAPEIEEWCKEWQNDPLMRIALCGYEDEYDLPGWDCIAWKAHGGYGNRSTQHDNPNARKERVWFSPHCLKPENMTQMEMF